METLEKIADEWKTLKAPFVRYTLSQTALNYFVIASQTDLVSAFGDAFTNLPFFAVVNLGYAKGVDCVTRRMGRIGANVFSIGVSGAFYGYALMTNETDPTVPSLVAGVVGLVLTNKQVGEVYCE